VARGDVIEHQVCPSVCHSIEYFFAHIVRCEERSSACRGVAQPRASARGAQPRASAGRLQQPSYGAGSIHFSIPSAFIASSTESAAKIIPMTLVRMDAPPTPIILIIRSERRSRRSVTARTPIIIRAVPICTEIGCRAI